MITFVQTLPLMACQDSDPGLARIASDFPQFRSFGKGHFISINHVFSSVTMTLFMCVSYYVISRQKKKTFALVHLKDMYIINTQLMIKVFMCALVL